MHLDLTVMVTVTPSRSPRLPALQESFPLIISPIFLPVTVLQSSFLTFHLQVAQCDHEMTDKFEIKISISLLNQKQTLYFTYFSLMDPK